MSAEHQSLTACPSEGLLIGSERAAENWFYFLNRIVLGAVALAYFRVSATGRRYIPLDGPLILASNHASLVDPSLIGLMCPRTITPLAKEELWRVPILKWYLDALGVVPVKRGRADVAAIRVAQHIIEEGRALLLFPEGTRTSDGRIAPLKRGVAWIACRTHAQVVPTYIAGSFQAFSRHHRFPRPRWISIHFGQPIQPPREGSVCEEHVEVVTQQLDEALRALELRYGRFDSSY